MTNKPVALITGASEGLGKHFALECARRQMNLVLIALPNTKLKNIARYITYNYGVRVWAFEKDLCAEGSCEAIHKAVKAQSITISVLINNAGMGGTFFFGQRSMEYYNTLMRLNMVVPTTLTHLFLDDLKQGTPAFILNVSSMAGLVPLPKKSVYGSSKAYLVTFSRSLRRELKQDNIGVTVLCPGGMNTSWQLTMHNRMTSSWLSRQSVLYPCDVARLAITKMLAGKEMVVPGRWNQLFLIWNRIFPKWFKNYLADYAMRKATLAAPAPVVIEPAFPAAAVA